MPLIESLYSIALLLLMFVGAVEIINSFQRPRSVPRDFVSARERRNLL